MPPYGSSQVHDWFCFCKKTAAERGSGGKHKGNHVCLLINWFLAISAKAVMIPKTYGNITPQYIYRDIQNKGKWPLEILSCIRGGIVHFSCGGPVSVDGKRSQIRQLNSSVYAVSRNWVLLLQNLPASSEVAVMSLDVRKNYRLFQLGFLVCISGQPGGVLDDYFCHVSHVLAKKAIATG